MEKFKTMQDFGSDGIIPFFEAIVTAVPQFFPVTLLCIWLFGSLGSYYAILAFTGKKRYLHAFTAMSFTCFLSSLLIVAMNTTTTTMLSGYWVGFYILMSGGGYLALSNYK